VSLHVCLVYDTPNGSAEWLTSRRTTCTNSSAESTFSIPWAQVQEGDITVAADLPATRPHYEKVGDRIQTGAISRLEFAGI